MKCKQCGKEMNPVEAMLSKTWGVCGNCTRKNHKQANGEK
jgi:predicted nucleic acid-binding Zn ribbon protein